MISYTVRMKFRSEDRERVAEVLTALAKAARKEPGCVHFLPHIVDGEPDTVVIYEQYADQKAVDAHRWRTWLWWPDGDAVAGEISRV